MAATLYLMPVPMAEGKPSDVLPARNIALVASIKDYIVENVRSARRFIKRCDPGADISAMTFGVLNVDTPREAVASLLEPLRRGRDMALVSEAGCPAVADPGALAVDAARREGFRIVPLAGPSSIIMALMASGFNGQSFAFRGYLPIGESERAAELRRLEKTARREGQTQIFIETPYRNGRLLGSIIKTLPGDMRLCVAVDLTGPGESVRTLPLARWGAEPPLPKLPAIFLLHRP